MSNNRLQALYFEYTLAPTTQSGLPFMISASSARRALIFSTISWSFSAYGAVRVSRYVTVSWIPVAV